MTTASNHYRGVRFNGHHTSEFGIYETTDDSIGMPSKVKMQTTPIGSNQIIDLSNLYGPVYDERTFTKTFLFDQAMWTPENQYQMWTRLVNWLMQPQGKVPMWDDIMADYHYLAEVQTAPAFKEDYHQGTLQVTWQCYPFRIRDHVDYDDDFDYFIEHSDYLAQEVHYKVGDRDTGTLINIGVSEVPITVTASAAATLTVNGQAFTLSAGDNTDLDLVLAPGDNKLALTGDAGVTADFSWYQEVI